MMRKQFIRLDTNNLVVGGGRPQNPPINNAEFTYIESEADLHSMLFGDNYFIWDGQDFVDTGESKSSLASNIWSKEQKKWVDGRDLEQKKADKWAEIKAGRSAEEFGTFEWTPFTFDSDETSQRRIQGAVQLAALDPNIVMDWTLADNTVQTFDAPELQGIGQALASHVNACHVKARDLRDQINAAKTEAELSVISW